MNHDIHALSWSVTDEHRATVVEFVKAVLDDENSSPRDRNRVAQLALTMNAQNLALMKLATPDVSVSVTADPEEAKRIAAELLQDPDYLEFLRTRLVEDYANAS